MISAQNRLRIGITPIMNVTALGAMCPIMLSPFSKDVGAIPMNLPGMSSGRVIPNTVYLASGVKPYGAALAASGSGSGVGNIGGGGEGGGGPKGPKSVVLKDFLSERNVKFGTSGKRALVTDLTDEVIYAETIGDIDLMLKRGDISEGDEIGVAIDRRESSPRIAASKVRAITDRGFKPVFLGVVPTPTAAYYGKVKNIPMIMVTGSHIPFDRNGVKTYFPGGKEFMHYDEKDLLSLEVKIQGGLFGEDEMFVEGERPELPEVVSEARDIYVQRYLDMFPADFLKGQTIGFYEHSTVGNEIAIETLTKLGATVIAFGKSDEFVAIDTEAFTPENVQLLNEWGQKLQGGELTVDSLKGIGATVYFPEGAAQDVPISNPKIIQTGDGDFDRPGTAYIGMDGTWRWLPGDLSSVFTAIARGATHLTMPVSTNPIIKTLSEEGILSEGYTLTKIGSTRVIEGRRNARDAGAYKADAAERNGGYLTAELDTRDAMQPLLRVLQLTLERGVGVAQILDELNAPYMGSDLLDNFPPSVSKAIITDLLDADSKEDRIAKMQKLLGDDLGRVVNYNDMDGLMIVLEDGSRIHLRGSNNAPQFRQYATSTRGGTYEEREPFALQLIRHAQEVMLKELERRG